MRLTIILSIFLLFLKTTSAQMGVTVNSNAMQLAQVIAGFGVTVSNASISCSSTGAGTFTYTGTHLGLTGGVLLTTGDATTAAQAQTVFSSTSSGNIITDPQLTAIDASATNDVCKLEFDFVPICPTISIKYVFGSEEYPTFVGSINDAFGIFLTGPNPAGGSFNNQNIALLPNGQPVSINNVNSSSNSPSFVANYNLSYGDIVYDGYTVPITSSATVTPCQSYHIKFAIADASDEAYDSGVFLQYDGLSCANTPTITPSSTASSCTGNTGSASVAVTGATPTAYSWQPGGQTTSSITSQAPGTYTCVLTFSAACTTYTQSQVVTIAGTGVTPTVAVSSNTPCTGGNLSLTANSNGTGFTWTGPNSFSSTTQNPTVTGVSAAGAGVYTLVVTSAGGCSQTTTLNITLSPSPTVTVNSPIVCAGSTATLNASGASTYAWTAGLSGSTGSSVTGSPAATTVYTVTGTSAAGCTGTATSTITVVSNPSITVTNATVCAGGSATLTASGASTYNWSPATGLSTTTGSVVTANPSATTVYTVSGSVGTCTAAPGTGTLTASPNPTVTASANTPICAPSTLSLTANGGTSYNWSGPGGFSSTLQNPTIASTSSVNTGVYTVTATALGCNASTTVSVTILGSSVMALPTIPAACLNSNVSLNAPAGGTAYIWSGPNGFTSTQQSPVINGVTIVNTGVYTVSVTVGACVNTGTVNVSTIPAISFLTIPADAVICAQRSATLSSQAQGGSGTYGYSWSPATGLDNPSAAIVVASPSATQAYTVTATDANCPSAPTVTAVATVTVNPLPVVTFSALATSGCEPFCTDFASQSTPTALNSLWMFSTGQSVSGNVLTPFCFNGHGTYDVKLIVTDINGCVDSLIKPSYITVYPKPIADFSWYPLTPTIISSKVDFTDQSTVGAPMTNWSWNFGDFYSPLSSDTSSLQNPSHVYPNIDSYSVTLAVTNQYGCKDTVTKVLVVEDEFAFYIPNAFTPWVPDNRNDVFSVAGTGFKSEDFKMYIFDRWGEMIFYSEDPYKGWDGHVKGGKMAKQDVYVYKIILKDFKDKKHEYVGHVTVL
ncbi:MAG: choice-of-anchor L domain-containing protein [Bacteroidetes bacterium]|nr:choice-of-anchor L domain-containing protein [Bacteroidota bacterium]